MEMLAIERMSSDAWERLRAIRMRALRDSPDAFWTTAAEEVTMTPGEWRRRLERSGAATFVARRAGADVGLVTGAPHHERQGDAGLYGMWVAPEARGTGAGVALISSVVQWARSAGYQSLRLEVGDANAPAVRLYERMGFVPTGVTATFPQPRAHITEHERVLDLSSALVLHCAELGRYSGITLHSAGQGLLALPRAGDLPLAHAGDRGPDHAREGGVTVLTGQRGRDVDVGPLVEVAA